ncbi:MAG: L-aspartate semialdehyde sulfurtransferase ferredoxin [Chloroflexota bacterium]|nr:L-aspartate semialdehyde sulfurtransferase ferredoxin [Chloroflexota bacterium]
MARLRVKLTFARGAVTQPVIYEMGHQFEIVTNIRRADITRDEGWVVLEMEGAQEALDNAVKYCEEKGVRVTPAEGDVVES